MSPLLGTLTLTVLIFVGLVLLLLSGLWLSRRLLFDRQSRKLTKRGELWNRLLILLGVCVPQIALRLADLKDRDWAATHRDWAWLAGLVALTCLSLWRLPSLWRAARAERIADATKGPSGPPSLRLQLLLILLPVLGLAVLGVVALARDRAAVEADARREAAAIAQELADRLSTSWPGNLSEVEVGAQAWSSAAELGLQGLPPPRTAEDAAISTRIRERARRHVRGSPEETFPVIARFAANGSLVDPPPYPPVPQPAAWTRDHSVLADAWKELETAELASTSPEQVRASALRVKTAAKVPGAALQAEFLALRYLPDGDPEAVGQLLQLGRRAVMERAESAQGLPLGLVVWTEAVRRVPEAILADPWLWLLGDLVLAQPSALTPRTLSLVEERAKRSGDQRHITQLSELRARWQGAERLRELSARLAGATRLQPDLLQNLWLTNRDAVWLAAVQPWHSVVFTTTNAVTITLTNRESHVRFFRADTLEMAAFDGLNLVAWVNGRERITPPRLPTGLALSLELEGKPLRVPAPRPVQDTPAPVLAEAGGEFRLEGEWSLGVAGKPQRFDVWPSRPKFTVRVHLADSAALFAALRRQQWLFGGMILVTAGVAGLGAWQVNRAFRRQLALNAEKSNFVASVSHELRTPLASLRLLAEGLAAGRVEEESKRREYAGFLVQETRRLGALVENVLDFARIEQGRKQYQFEPTDLGRLVTATVRLFEPLAAERQVRLELKLPEGPTEPGGSLELNADGAALQQALVNLLDNALKHAPADSAVTVALERADRAPLGWLRLCVSDAGPGIPPEDHERIFERFFRRGSELRRETQGIGLGLAIVKHIVAVHRGRVWVESQPGQGARFVVELPIGENSQCSVASNQSVERNDQ